MRQTTAKQRKEADTQRRMKEIQEVALRLFSTRGYAGTTLDAVAAELGYTKQALYYYFKNKDDLVRSLIASTLGKALETMNRLSTSNGTPADNLRELIDFYLEEHLAGHGFFHIFHHVEGFMDQLLAGEESQTLKAQMARFSSLVMDILEKGVTQGYFISEDPRTLGGIILAMVSGLVQHADGPMFRGSTREKLKSTVIDIIMKGVTRERN